MSDMSETRWINGGPGCCNIPRPSEGDGVNEEETFNLDCPFAPAGCALLLFSLSNNLLRKSLVNARLLKDLSFNTRAAASFSSTVPHEAGDAACSIFSSTRVRAPSSLQISIFFASRTFEPELSRRCAHTGKSGGKLVIWNQTQPTSHTFLSALF